MTTDLAPVPRIAGYLGAFEGRERGALQRAAMDSFLELGFPGSKEEDWKFTNIAPLTKSPFELAEAGDAARALKLADKLPGGEERIVFVNGRAIAPRRVDSRHLAQYADYRKRPFVALNTAFLEDVAYVHVPAGAAIEKPFHVVHVFLPGERARAAHPRNLFVFEERSQASVIETYIGEAEYFTNAVTEIVVGENAVVNHVKLQRESERAFHLSTIQVEQGRGSVFTSRSFAFGGALARTEINAVLEEGSECTLNGLYLVHGKQHVDTRTTIDHAKPHAASHELYKGILDGQASAVFNGKIIVRKDAQKTDAKQTNKNLVLSEDATINTKPQLEIFADDVKCTHGATVGQLDADSMFYLRSRGIGAPEARKMLIRAFAGEIADGVKFAPLRDYIERLL